jgi:ABC-type transport system involved in multi-copper enzyme maturation permease subunit
MTLMRQYFRDLWWIALGYFVLLEGAMVAAILYWPQFRDNIPAIAKLVPFQALQDLIEHMHQSGYWPYFAVQHWFKGCSLFGVAAIAFMGSGIIAREADQRTAEFLLSRPISRRQVLLSRFTVLALATCIPVYVTSLSAIWISASVGEYMSVNEILLSATYMSCFLIMMCGLVTMLSAMSTNQFRAGTILIGIVLLNFAIYLVQSIDMYSLFKTIDVWAFMDIHMGNTPWNMVGIFVGVTIVELTIADWVFRRRTF